VTRVLEDLTINMQEAQDQWDSVTVVRLGMRCMLDLQKCEFRDQNMNDKAEHALYEFMARAFGRQKKWGLAIEFFDRDIAVSDRIQNFPRKGRCLHSKAEMLMSMGRYDDAKSVYQAVYDIGEKGGYFELYGKASLGLSRVAQKSGDTRTAMELAEEARKAAGLFLDDQWGKNRLEAEAILAIIRLSDIQAAEFDDKLIEKALLLGAAVDADTREGGAMLTLQAMELQGQRQMFMGKLADSANTYAQLLVHAKQDRFRQMADVGAMSERVTQHLKMLVDIGVVDVRV
jgi:tetratricopeptide (TPR) repeat protein